MAALASLTKTSSLSRCGRYGTSYGQAPLTPAQLSSWTRALESYRDLARARTAGAPPQATEGAADDVGSAAWAVQLAPALHLPAPNEFIATDFELRHEGLRAKVAAGVSLSAEVATSTANATGPREPQPVLLRNDARASVWREWPPPLPRYLTLPRQ